MASSLSRMNPVSSEFRHPGLFEPSCWAQLQNSCSIVNPHPSLKIETGKTRPITSALVVAADSCSAVFWSLSL